jgi:hypothetical protein
MRRTPAWAQYAAPHLKMYRSGHRGACSAHLIDPLNNPWYTLLPWVSLPANNLQHGVGFMPPDWHLTLRGGVTHRARLRHHQLRAPTATARCCARGGTCRPPPQMRWRMRCWSMARCQRRESDVQELHCSSCATVDCSAYVHPDYCVSGRVEARRTITCVVSNHIHLLQWWNATAADHVGMLQDLRS